MADPDYFIELAEIDNQMKYSKEELAKSFRENAGEFWVVLNEHGFRYGAVGYFKFGDVYLFDGLRDNKVPNMGFILSKDCSKKVIDYIFTKTKVLYACARKRSKAVQRLLKSLGFIQIDASPNLATTEDLVWFKREEI
jgi:hypothetical protein